MKLERERGSILKNGSRIGYLMEVKSQCLTRDCETVVSWTREALLLTTTKSSMLQDMRHTCGVRRVRLESDAENIVLVFSCNMQVIRVCLVML